jgi:hypothetical protein
VGSVAAAVVSVPTRVVGGVASCPQPSPRLGPAAAGAFVASGASDAAVSPIAPRIGLFNVAIPVVRQAVASVIDDSFNRCFESRVRTLCQCCAVASPTSLSLCACACCMFCVVLSRSGSDAAARQVELEASVSDLLHRRVHSILRVFPHSAGPPCCWTAAVSHGILHCEGMHGRCSAWRLLRAVLC